MNLLTALSVSDTRRRVQADLKLEDREELGIDKGCARAVFYPGR
jgi:hypothetical protein